MGCPLTPLNQNGLVIPSGTTVVANHWSDILGGSYFSCDECVYYCRSVLHDPDVFPDPESFSLDRWLNDQGKLKTDVKMHGFGFGRRCVLFSLCM